MLLKSVEYYNFRPFIDKQKIILENDSSKSDANVIVLLGDNTHGKSTFVLSFIWCFYGLSKFKRPNDILNTVVVSHMKPAEKQKAYVKVEFEDDGKVYTMTRTQQFIMQESGELTSEDSIAELTYVVNNETKSVGTQSDIQQAIRSILPKDLSSFFFFEGEKENEITRKDLSSAVKTLIGLEAFDNMRKHLHGPNPQKEPTNASVMGQYLSKQSDESGVAAQKAFEKKSKAEEELETIIKYIEELTKNQKFYKEQIERINQKLREAGPSKEYQKRRDTISKEIKFCIESEEKKNKEFLKKFSENSLSLFLTPFLEKVSDKLKEMDVSDKGIIGIEARAIRELLRRGECLCGTDLKEGTLAYKNVEKYIDYVPPKSLGALVRDMQEKIDEFSGKNVSFVDEMENLYKEILLLRSRVNQLENEDKDLLGKIEEVGVIDTTVEENNLYSYRKSLNDLEDKLNTSRIRQGSLQTEIESATKAFNMHKDKSQKAKRFQIYYKYAETIYDWVQKNYDEKEAEVRNKLNHHIQDLFNKMYVGNREISIDDKYNILLTYNGKPMDDSGGLRVIQYFSYVGALVKTAFEVMTEKNNNEEISQGMLGEQYPLVLDAAFSHADATHTGNIAKELSKASRQLIFAVMEKDWNYAKVGLDGRVIRIYELEKMSEEKVIIKEI